MSELNDFENRIAEERKLKEDAIKIKDEERKLKEEAIKIKDEEIKLKEEAIKIKDDAVKLLLKLGLSTEEIASQLNLPIDKINVLSDV